MSRIVVTDSTSCLNMLGYQGKVQIIPFNLHIGSESYLDGINITVDDFVGAIRKDPKQDLSSSPLSKKQMINLYGKWLKNGVTEIIFVTISSQLSELNNIIRSIAPRFNNKIETHLFDTLTTGVAVGQLALLAQRGVDKGLNSHAIMEKLAITRQNMVTFFTVDDLNYLIKNKRLSAPAGLVGKLLHIKPILSFDETGKIVPHSKKQGWQQAIEAMCDTIKQQTQNDNLEMMLLHPHNEEGTKFEAIMKQHFPDAILRATLPSPVVMCHTGPDIYGVVATARA